MSRLEHLSRSEHLEYLARLEHLEYLARLEHLEHLEHLARCATYVPYVLRLTRVARREPWARGVSLGRAAFMAAVCLFAL